MVRFFLLAALTLMGSRFVLGQDQQLPSSSEYSTSLVSGLVAEEAEIRAGLMYDVKRGQIIWQKDMDYSYPIASLTKMMVGLLAVEDIEAGKVCPDDTIKVTRSYRKKTGRRRYTTYSVEEKYSLEALLKMAMVASHNESTVWIAKHCSGSLSDFVERMNRRALELGMTKTQYSNPSGLPAIIDELDNHASPRDLLALSLEVLKHPKLMEVCAIPYATVHNGRSDITYRNHNGLVITYGEEVDGMKTGYTKAAKFCLVATSNRAGHRLISIVLGVRSPWVRNGIVASMMNNYYDAIRLGRLGETQSDPQVHEAFMDSLNKGLAEIRVPVVLPLNSAEETDYAITYKTVTEKVRKTHSVRRGETLSGIAGKYNVTVTDIRKWNKLRSNTIQSGQKLTVYTRVTRKVPVRVDVDPDESYADNQPSQDTTGSVETEIRSLSSHQHLTDSTNKPKEEVLVDQVKTPEKVTTTSSSYVYHKVVPGDTLWNIAQRYSATVDQIKKANKITNPRSLKSGTRIRVPVNGG